MNNQGAAHSQQFRSLCTCSTSIKHLLDSRKKPLKLRFFDCHGWGLFMREVDVFCALVVSSRKQSKQFAIEKSSESTNCIVFCKGSWPEGFKGDLFTRRILPPTIGSKPPNRREGTVISTQVTLATSHLYRLSQEFSTQDCPIFNSNYVCRFLVAHCDSLNSVPNFRSLHAVHCPQYYSNLLSKETVV